MSTVLAESELVGEWKQSATYFICPPSPDEPTVCDCGYDGPWETRSVFTWYEHPGYRRGDRTIRKDMAHGWPPRPKDEGWYVIGGWDERCPSCGDIERFDHTGAEVAHFAEQAKVVVHLAFGRRDATGANSGGG